MLKPLQFLDGGGSNIAARSQYLTRIGTAEQDDDANPKIVYYLTLISHYIGIYKS